MFDVATLFPLSLIHVLLYLIMTEACPPHGLINKSSSNWIEDSKCLRKPLKPKRLTSELITKKLRNDLTSDVRKAKTAYLKRKFDDVQTTSAY